MTRQEYVLTELEAIGKDIIIMVDEEQGRIQREAEIQAAAARKVEEEREKGERVPVASVRAHDPNRLLPELSYLQTRLAAVKDYITQDRP